MADRTGLATLFVESLERREWDKWSALLHPSVVYELPQTGEVVRGRDAYLRFNREYPGDWHLAVRRTITEGRYAAVWLAWRMGGTSETGDAIVFLEYDQEGLVTSVTDFWPERYDAPPGREDLTGLAEVRRGGSDGQVARAAPASDSGTERRAVDMAGPEIRRSDR